jgi:GNAT superfamily N-acetyltransferase
LTGPFRLRSTHPGEARGRVVTSPFSLRRTRLSDTKEIATLHVAIWQEAYAGVMDADYLGALDPVEWAGLWRRRLVSGLYDDSWVATDCGGRRAIVGFVAVGLARDHPPVADHELYVLNASAAVRGSGVSGLLIDKVLARTSMSLWVVEENPRAVAFYERRGFVRDGARLWDPRARTHDVRMVRPAP